MNDRVLITANEAEALQACLNYETREQQLADNFSNGGVDEFVEVLGWTRQQVGGLITSMESKGLGYLDQEDDVFWLTEKGVAAIFDWIEAIPAILEAKEVMRRL